MNPSTPSKKVNMDVTPQMWRKEGARQALCDVTIWLRDEAANLLWEEDLCNEELVGLERITRFLALEVQKRIRHLDPND